MNIDKIKKAIRSGGSLATPNPDGTMVIMPPNLNYLMGVTLTAEEYQIYVNVTTLTIAEKIERLLVADKQFNLIAKSSDRSTKSL